MKSCRNLTR